MITESMDDRVPLTLLTGFLGAGKTTLLNHLIRDPGAGRIAVIMNEFGDIGLDHDLIEASTEETVLLQSGCLCCTIRGDLLVTLGKLMARRHRGELDFDRVVIETTGIADPGPILHSLIIDNVVAPYYRMDGVVTVADAVTGPQTLDAHYEAVQQIAMADLIVLSKADLATPHGLARFEARLDGINGTARRLRSEQGRVPPGTLFGLSALRKDVSTAEISDWLGAEAAKPDPLAGISGFAQPLATPAIFSTPANHTPHDHRIVSASFEMDGPIEPDVFDLWLDTLVAFKGPNILRIKGIVHLEGMDRPFVFHGVQHMFDPPVYLRGWTGVGRTCRVVVIARDMSGEELQASLDMLRMRPLDEEAEKETDQPQTQDMPF